MKLGLGTVQFGMDYGISNPNGKVSNQEISKILQFAKKNNIDTIDTAQGYGDSEKVLGNFNLSDFKIISKMRATSDIKISLENLNVTQLHALLFHNETEIDEESYHKFEKYKQNGLIHKLGVSVYSPQKLLEIINNFPIDIVQLPLNILDQRFLPLLPLLKKYDIEIHIRSVFLQGLLLMNVSEIPRFFDPIKPILKQIPENKIATCLNFVKNKKEVDRIIIGTTSCTELQEILTDYHKNINLDYSKYSVTDEQFILPMNWNKK